MTVPAVRRPVAPTIATVAPVDLMVVGLLALAAFGVPGVAALAWLKLRARDDDGSDAG